MRIAFFAKSHKHSGITAHMERAMGALGHTVLRINRRKVERLVGKRLAWWWIRRRLAAFRPDVVLVFTFDLPAARLAELRSVARTATFFDDCPEVLSQRIHDAARASDVFFITNRGQIELYEREVGVTPAYVTGGCDPVDHFRVPPDPRFASEVAFIGKGNPGGGRVELMRTLAQHFDLKLYGAGWEQWGLEPAARDVYPAEYRAICNSAKVVIGIDLRDDVDLYFSNRTWISLGCGAFLATRYVPNLEEVLSAGEQCVWFKDPDDAVRVIREWLGREEDRARVAAAGHAHAHANYSYARMIERMLAHPALASAPAAAPADAGGQTPT